MKDKPTLSFWQIWNMSFGFLGIQFGWALQMANMGPIYEYLGAEPDKIPLLFLAAPLTGLIVQPIIGYLSDNTWGRLGRRKPYFLIGAIFSTIALILMPNSSALWMAAGLLWILDASINVSMEPFRAFVADLLPKKQHTEGFTMQSFFIGLGAVIAAALPWFFANVVGLENTAGEGQIPETVKFSFYLGALAFISAVLYTIFKTKEYPPEDLEAFRAKQQEGGFVKGFKEIIASIGTMPKRMKQLALVQFFTWPGLFLMWFYFSTAVARNVMGATDPKSELYAEGVEWANLCFGFYSLITFMVAFQLPKLAAKIGQKQTHALCLLFAAVGLFSVGFIQSKYLLLLSMTGIGIGWASILSMPYAMLAPSLDPKKVGIYMGIFNFFIVLPEIIASLAFGWIMLNFLGNDRIAGLMVGAGLFVIAAILTFRVDLSEETEWKFE